jgi:hypothetical protein
MTEAQYLACLVYVVLPKLTLPIHRRWPGTWRRAKTPGATRHCGYADILRGLRIIADADGVIRDSTKDVGAALGMTHGAVVRKYRQMEADGLIERVGVIDKFGQVAWRLCDGE